MTHLSDIADENERLEAERAMVFLDTRGSTCYAPDAWEFETADGGKSEFKFAEGGYATEWLPESDLGCERDQCVTVLSYGWSTPVPAGYRIADQYQVGEKECPWCDASGVLNGGHVPDDLKGSRCKLCEGDGYLYNGEDCTVVVFAPRYSYGSGSVGCLYDNDPNFATSIDDAIDSLVSDFDAYFEELAQAFNHDDLHNGAQLSDDEWRALDVEAAKRADSEESRMRAELKANGIFYFSRRDLAGADYCEINDLGTGE